MKQQATRFRLNVWITAPHDPETDEPEETGLEIEKRLFKILKHKTDFDADCEYMDSERIVETAEEEYTHGL